MTGLADAKTGMLSVRDRYGQCLWSLADRFASKCVSNHAVFEVIPTVSRFFPITWRGFDHSELRFSRAIRTFRPDPPPPRLDRQRNRPESQPFCRFTSGYLP